MYLFTCIFLYLSFFLFSFFWGGGGWEEVYNIVPTFQYTSLINFLYNKLRTIDELLPFSAKARISGSIQATVSAPSSSSSRKSRPDDLPPPNLLNFAVAANFKARKWEKKMNYKSRKIDR